jgi:hypothetical protein
MGGKKFFWGFIHELFGQFLAFGSFVVHGVSTHGFLIPSKELES